MSSVWRLVGRQVFFQQICEDRERQEAVLGWLCLPGLLLPRRECTCVPGVRATDEPSQLCGMLRHRHRWCKEHGNWFDHNELRQVVEFIQAGGLKKSREREKARLGRRIAGCQKELRLTADRNCYHGSSRVSAGWHEDEGSVPGISVRCLERAWLTPARMLSCIFGCAEYPLALSWRREHNSS
jgi:hypothetical protein